MVARVIDHPFGTGVIPTPYNPDPTLLAIVEIIRDGLIRDQHVRLHNFGTFRLRWSKERQQKHPKTGAVITVGPVPKVTFTPAKHLREMIDPDRKPSIPLDDPAISESPNTQAIKNIHQIKPGSSGENHLPTQEQKKNNVRNLREAVQDVIDEDYNSPEKLIDIFHFQQGEKKENEQKFNKKWALGLLAAVPLILMLLQADFTDNRDTSAAPITPTELSTVDNQTNEGTISSIPKSQPEQNLSATSQPGTNSQSGIDNKSLASARPEPASKPFYMSPQLHTIQTGENLWKLAERFYGDALLWPHIFRANMRTLTNPDNIISGKQLVIPGLQQAPDNLSIKDKELIAEGYYEVYQINRINHSQQAIYFLIGAKQYSLEWLTKMRSAIPRNDWDIIK